MTDLPWQVFSQDLGEMMRNHKLLIQVVHSYTLVADLGGKKETN